jgi:thiol-disulfide isomerase/thioredoxin
MNIPFFDQKRWLAGATLPDYVDAMASNQEAMRRRLQSTALAEEDRRFFGRMVRPILVAVMTEDWCGDSLMALPILARIVQAIPGAEMRLYRRDETSWLREHYRSRDIGNIPVFTFMDEAYGEIGSWVERSAAAHERRRQWMEKHPEIQATSRSSEMPLEEKQRLLRPQMAGMMELMEGWYDAGLQRATVDELKQVIHG